MLRYSLQLSRSMGLPHSQIMQWGEEELWLQMAFDRSQSDDFIQQYEAAKERERQAKMTPQQRGLLFAQSLGLNLS